MGKNPIPQGQAFFEIQPPRRLACPLAGQAGAVAAEHLRRAPPHDAHEIRLAAVRPQPGVRGRVPELVRVQLAQTGLPAAAGEHLRDAGAGQRPPAAFGEPQLRLVGEAVPAPSPEVPLEGLRGLVLGDRMT